LGQSEFLERGSPTPEKRFFYKRKKRKGHGLLNRRITVALALLRKKKPVITKRREIKSSDASDRWCNFQEEGEMYGIRLTYGDEREESLLIIGGEEEKRIIWGGRGMKEGAINGVSAGERGTLKRINYLKRVGRPRKGGIPYPNSKPCPKRREEVDPLPRRKGGLS